MILLSFFIPGKPVPWQEKATVPGSKYGRMTSSSNREYKKRVTSIAQGALLSAGIRCLPCRSPEVPVAVSFMFYLPRPKSVKRSCPVTRPDLSKLIRPIEDALSGVVYHDDSQIVTLRVSKMYADDAAVGVMVIISEG